MIQLFDKQANSENCGPLLGNKFDLKVGQRSPSRSQHGTIRKVLSKRTHMPSIKALPVKKQKLRPRLKFLWQMDGQTDRQTNDIKCPRAFAKAGDNYQDPTLQWGVMAQTEFWVCVHCDLDLGDMTLGYGTPLGHGQQLYEILSRSNMAVRSYGPGTDFQYVHCDLDLGDMTLAQGHDTTLGHGQQLCEILSKYNMAVRSYGTDKEFQYVCTVTLTLKTWPWVKVMPHPWIMDNNCVKYYSDPIWQWGVMARTRILGMCSLWPRPWVKVMTHPWVMDNNCVKYYPDPTRQWGVIARTRILGMSVHC